MGRRLADGEDEGDFLSEEDSASDGGDAGDYESEASSEASDGADSDASDSPAAKPKAKAKAKPAPQSARQRGVAAARQQASRPSAAAAKPAINSARSQPAMRRQAKSGAAASPAPQLQRALPQPAASAAAASGTPRPDEEGEVATEASQQRRAENIAAMLGGSLQLERRALLPKLLSVSQAEAALRKPFKSPHPSAPNCSDLLRHKMQMRRRFVPWGSKTPLPPPPVLLPLPAVSPAPEEPATSLPPHIEPLVLWEPPEGEAGPAVEVDAMLTQWLRPHQREGVQFMFECVAGLKGFGGRGCILADDMGLGKTLQGITLLWTLLQCGHPLLGGTPLAKRVVICCPTSLVSNWDSECSKWLKGRVRTLPLCESSRDDVIFSVKQFISPAAPFQVMIVSYETFRLHADKFQAPGTCDLLICDEAHRLKNDQTLTNKALASMDCKARVLLSGTPLQNHLDEFYAMVNFCNPGVLGSPSEFRRRYEAPILQGREPDSTADQAQLGCERSEELSAQVNEFILRRTNALLSAHLPPKVIEVVCCKMTPLQTALYSHFLASNAARSLLQTAERGKKSARVLSAITSLKKLCNHPKLIYDSVHGREGAADGFEGCSGFFPPGLFDDGRTGRGGMCEGWELLSGKFAVLATLLDKLHRQTSDRVVIVSNYTQTLDLFQALCRTRNYPCLRLDGSTSLNKRQKLVLAFNDLSQRQFVFLLSSKAGGCGLNLVGGNRLVLFDPDWNPANDKQAAGRVWRDGQKKRVFVYRFLTTGSIEEKVYQRQLSKEGLQTVVNSDAKGGGSALMSTEELRDLFTLRDATASDTFDSVCAGSSQDSEKENEPPPPERLLRAQVGAPAEEDLKSWGQHSGAATVPDEMLQQVGEALPGTISFVFTCQVAGKPIEEEPVAGPKPTAEQVASGRSSLALQQQQASGSQRTPAAAPSLGRFKLPASAAPLRPSRFQAKDAAAAVTPAPASGQPAAQAAAQPAAGPRTLPAVAAASPSGAAHSAQAAPLCGGTGVFASGDEAGGGSVAAQASAQAAAEGVLADAPGLSGREQGQPQAGSGSQPRSQPQAAGARPGAPGGFRRGVARGATTQVPLPARSPAAETGQQKRSPASAPALQSAGKKRRSPAGAEATSAVAKARTPPASLPLAENRRERTSEKKRRLQSVPERRPLAMPADDVIQVSDSGEE